MANIQIYVTPTSITIYDGEKNRVAIRKVNSANFKSAELTPEISAHDTRVRNSAVELANTIIELLSQKSKDNFAKRFSRLHKFLSGIETHSFETLRNKLRASVIPVTAETPVIESLEVEVA